MGMNDSDDSEIVIHSNDVDAPVILLVPHKWHLEEKQVSSIQFLPSPIAQYPPGDRPSDSFQSPQYPLSHDVSEDISILVRSIPNDTTHLTVITSSTAVLHQLLNTLSSRSTLTPILSLSASSTFHCFPQSLPSTHVMTWMSRSVWCPPPLDTYSLIAVTSRYVSVPLILPLQPDSLLFTATSTEESLSLVQVRGFYNP